LKFIQKIKTMGWTSYPMHKPVKEWFKEQWENSSAVKYEVIDSALVKRNTLYGAIRIKESGEIFCAVFLIRWSRDVYNFSYKDMTEHSGPCVCDCPQRIMKLLSPLNDENDNSGYARDWRKRVENYWEKRNTLKKNKEAIIKTKTPVQFTNGNQYQYFKKIGRTIWAGDLTANEEFFELVRVRLNFSHFEYELLTN
jgi:hypothetical protein